MSLSPADAAQLAQYRAAYAALISGQLVSEITSNGRTVKYGKADMGRLQEEIARLESQATTGRTGRRRGAISFSL